MTELSAFNAPSSGEKKEFWRWDETAWVDESRDWRSAKVLT